MTKRVVLVYPNIVTGWQSRRSTALPLSLLCLVTSVRIQKLPKKAKAQNALGANM